MVRLLITLLLIHLPLKAFSSPDLSLLIEQDKQQLGYAFKAKIIATDSNDNLSSIDLTPLQKDFGVIVNEYSGANSNTKNGSQQQLSIELFPRRTGLIHIPALLLSSASSRPTEVEVLPAIGASGPINIEYNVSTSQPWQRQQVLLTVQVTTPDRFSRLETKAPQSADSEFRRITPSKELLPNATRLKTGWSIFPLQSGAHTISLPAIHYHLQGSIERRFYLPEIQLNVKPLPDYIPPLMPVGRVLIDSKIDADTLLNTGDVYNWTIRLHSTELLTHLLPPVLRQINSSNNINFRTTASERREIINFSGSNGEVIHTIPFQSLTTGGVNLPIIRVQYFDPTTGRVTVINHSPEKIWSLAIFWQFLIVIMILFAVTFIAKVLWRLLSRLQRKSRSMNEAILSIREAPNPESLRNSLRLISKAESWSENTSLNKWGKQWDSHYSPSIVAVVEELSDIYYANSSNDLIKLKNDILNIIARKKSNRRWFHFIYDCNRASL